MSIYRCSNTLSGSSRPGNRTVFNGKSGSVVGEREPARRKGNICGIRRCDRSLSGALDKRSLAAPGTPARAEGVADAQLVEYPGDDEIDQIADGLRVAIEAGRGRKDDRAGAGKLEHVLEVDRGKRRLTWNEHQRPALLEHHVGGALDQLVGK